MTYEEAVIEIDEFYRDYQPEYAHDFTNGVIYALEHTQRISVEQSSVLRVKNERLFHSHRK
jgi:glutathionyl-hydroquinone reductase